MKKGGVGGGKTISGLHFEKRSNLLTMIAQLKGYTVKNDEIYYHGETIAISLCKHNLYNYLLLKGVDYKKIFSSRLFPDNSLYFPKLKRYIVLELKFQEVSGSTDEKLQTCDYKIKQYKKLFKEIDPEIQVEYIYVLNDWFKKERYKDVLNYIRTVPNCSYYFNTIPLTNIYLSV